MVPRLLVNRSLSVGGLSWFTLLHYVSFPRLLYGMCVGVGVFGESGSHILQALPGSVLGQVPPSDLRVLSVRGWVPPKVHFSL